MSKSIMAFDYEPRHLLLYEVILSPYGYQVSCSEQDWLDFEALDATQPDLIIWGHVYGFDNRELDMVEALRNHPSTQQLPVLLVTTATKEVLDIYRLQTLVNLYLLTKPFDAQELLDAVELALGSSRLADITR